MSKLNQKLKSVVNMLARDESWMKDRCPYDVFNKYQLIFREDVHVDDEPQEELSIKHVKDYLKTNGF